MENKMTDEEQLEFWTRREREAKIMKLLLKFPPEERERQLSEAMARVRRSHFHVVGTRKRRQIG
jgi:hypothetical protein